MPLASACCPTARPQTPPYAGRATPGSRASMASASRAPSGDGLRAGRARALCAACGALWSVRWPCCRADPSRIWCVWRVRAATDATRAGARHSVRSTPFPMAAGCVWRVAPILQAPLAPRNAPRPGARPANSCRRTGVSGARTASGVMRRAWRRSAGPTGTRRTADVLHVIRTRCRLRAPGRSTSACVMLGMSRRPTDCAAPASRARCGGTGRVCFATLGTIAWERCTGTYVPSTRTRRADRRCARIAGRSLGVWALGVSRARTRPTARVIPGIS